MCDAMHKASVALGNSVLDAASCQLSGVVLRRTTSSAVRSVRPQVAPEPHWLAAIAPSMKVNAKSELTSS